MKKQDWTTRKDDTVIPSPDSSGASTVLPLKTERGVRGKWAESLRSWGSCSGWGNRQYTSLKTFQRGECCEEITGCCEIALRVGVIVDGLGREALSEEGTSGLRPV